MKFFLLDGETMPCPGTHKLHVRKFASGFESHGFEILEIASMSVLESEARRTDFVYISSHGINISNGKFLADLEKLSKIPAIPIFWHWHKHVDLLQAYFGQRFILTGENILASDPLPTHALLKDLKQHDFFLPTIFSSTIDDYSEFPTNPRTRTASYIGAKYKKHWNKQIKVRFPRSKIINTPPFITEEERLGYYRTSLVGLGWHSPNNITNGVVVERVFDAMGAGAIVLTDNPYAEQETDGNAIYVSTLEGAIEKIKRLKQNRKEWESMSLESFKWTRSNRTYNRIVKQFIDYAIEIA